MHTRWTEDPNPRKGRSMTTNNCNIHAKVTIIIIVNTVFNLLGQFRTVEATNILVLNESGAYYNFQTFELKD